VTDLENTGDNVNNEEPMIKSDAEQLGDVAQAGGAVQAMPVEPLPVTTETTTAKAPQQFDELDGMDNTGLDEEDASNLQVRSDFIPPYHETTLPQEKAVPEGKKINMSHALNTILRATEFIDEFVRMFPNESLSGTALGELLPQAVENASNLHLLSDTIHMAVNESGVSMHQKVPYADKGTIHAAVMNPNSTLGKRLEGEAAVLKLSYALGEKRILRFPMYATGIWLSIKPPSDESIYTLYTQMIVDKETTGRESGGGIFSNTQVVLMQRLVEFGLDHIYESNYKVNNREALLRVIRVPDIHQLLIFTLAAIYQSGFPFSSTCIEDKARCNYQRKTLLNIASMSRTFTNKLSEEQKRFMYSRHTSVDDEQLAKYQADFVYSQDLLNIPLNEAVSMQLRVPTLLDYFEVGNAWVGSLIEKADTLIKMELNPRQRKNYIDGLKKMSILRQYGHWVKSFTLNGEVVTDQAGITGQLNSSSGVPEHVDLIFGSIDRFITESTLTVCALIEDKKCPKCGGTKTDMPLLEDQPHTHLMVLDPCSLFFILAGLHIARILERE